MTVGSLPRTPLWGNVASSTSPLVVLGRLRSVASQMVSVQLETSVGARPRLLTWYDTVIVVPSKVWLGAVTALVTRSAGGSGLMKIELTSVLLSACGNSSTAPFELVLTMRKQVP